MPKKVEVPRYAPVGAIVKSGYWRTYDLVIAHNKISDDDYFGTVTVVALDGHGVGRVRSHSTRFAYPRFAGDSQADVIVGHVKFADGTGY